jgi:hypothetical protein
LPDVSTETEEYGKQFAENLRFVVTQMHNNTDDFSNMENIKSAVTKYLSVNMSGSGSKSISVEDVDKALETRAQYVTNLTPLQIAFREKIDEARVSSRSSKEFLGHLNIIMREIKNTVPEIQQRNLLKATATLYYVVKELDALIEDGLMPVNINNSLA